MIKTIFHNILLGKAFKKHVEQRKRVLDEAEKKQKEAEARIDSMIAQINGCGDRWFLQPRSSLDDCMEEMNNHQNGG